MERYAVKCIGSRSLIVRGAPSRLLESVLIIISLLSLLSCLTGCGYKVPAIQPLEPNVVSLDPKDWYFFFSAGMPSHPSSDPEGAWSFQFPSSEAGGHVNYLQTPFNLTTTPENLTLTFEVESDAPQYVVEDPADTLPATFRPFFEVQNDDLVNPNGRWWADTSAAIYNLGSQDGQTLTFVMPLTPNLWANVDGQQDAQEFAAALANVGWVGMTFGGQTFAGHGVAISSGSAKFILINYSIK